MKDLRNELLTAFKQHAKGHIEKHRMNVEVYLSHPVGIGEHPDVMEAIESEMKEIAEYDDLLEMVEKYFNS